MIGSCTVNIYRIISVMMAYKCQMQGVIHFGSWEHDENRYKGGEIIAHQYQDGRGIKYVVAE
jgi:hypothetical protein